MIELARRAAPGLVAIFYLASSATPCPLIAPSPRRVGVDHASAAVETAREPDSHAHHDVAVDVGEPDTSLAAPCPCGCGSQLSVSSPAKRLGTAVVSAIDPEMPRTDSARPLASRASVRPGERQLPDPIPIPS